MPSPPLAPGFTFVFSSLQHHASAYEVLSARDGGALITGAGAQQAMLPRRLARCKMLYGYAQSARAARYMSKSNDLRRADRTKRER